MPSKIRKKRNGRGTGFVFRLAAWFLSERGRYRTSWCLVAATIIGLVIFSKLVYRDSRRADGTGAHTFIDFGGQWCMGRMVLLGRGHDLYRRYAIRAVVKPAYPRSAEPPWTQLSEKEQKDFQHDAEALLDAMMGSDDPEALASTVTPLAARTPWQLAAFTLQAQQDTASNPAAWNADRLGRAIRDRGGCLYPPVEGLLYAPLGLLPPLPALRCFQVVLLLLGIAAAGGICLMTGRRVWWPVAIVCVLLFPGAGAALGLGQNSMVTLTIVVWGWVLVQHGRPGCAGIVWGLLAFKPTWGLAFFLVPLLTRRWRMCLAMIGSGLALALVTLPFVGVGAWRDWLAVGHDAAQLYAGDVNWIHIGRDVINIPRRWLDFEHTTVEERAANLPATVVGWCLLASIFIFTVVVALRRQQVVQGTTGTGAAFLFLGAWLSCYHFIYYDALLVAPAIFLLFADVRPYLEPRLVAVLRVRAACFGHRYQPMIAEPLLDPPPLPMTHRYTIWTLNRAEPTLVLVFVLWSLNLPLEWIPGDTMAMIVLWLWCGVQLLRRTSPPVDTQPVAIPVSANASQFVQLGANIGGAH